MGGLAGLFVCQAPSVPNAVSDLSSPFVGDAAVGAEPMGRVSSVLVRDAAVVADAVGRFAGHLVCQSSAHVFIVPGCTDTQPRALQVLDAEWNVHTWYEALRSLEVRHLVIEEDVRFQNLEHCDLFPTTEEEAVVDSQAP